jgi:hypothetical protein
MDKEQDKASVKAKVLSLPVTGRVTLDENDGRSYVVMILDNPFPSETLDEIRLTFMNPSKVNDFGKTLDRIGEKNAGLFDYYARKALAAAEFVNFTGEVQYRRFKNRTAVIDYVPIFIKCPFPDMGEDRKDLRVFISKARVQSLFEHLAKPLLELQIDQKK